ncbi:MAG: TIGR04338 family metallohydrolase [Nocardiaceae bacterium]|nr:TIGR04338 family metallohydrolase [Nocardiaceae bacterium]
MIDRDSQRSRVYDAEKLVRAMFDNVASSSRREVQLHGSTITLPIERRFASVESVQHYVDRVLSLNWVRNTWPEAAIPVTVRSRAGQTAAHYEPQSATIAVPPGQPGRVWAMRELVVLHELAHHLAPRTPNGAPQSSSDSPHGPAFLGRLLTLVSELIGAEAAFVLRVTLHDCGAQEG